MGGWGREDCLTLTSGAVPGVHAHVLGRNPPTPCERYGEMSLACLVLLWFNGGHRTDSCGAQCIAVISVEAKAEGLVAMEAPPKGGARGIGSQVGRRLQWAGPGLVGKGQVRRVSGGCSGLVQGGWRRASREVQDLLGAPAAVGYSVCPPTACTGGMQNHCYRAQVSQVRTTAFDRKYAHGSSVSHPMPRDTAASTCNGADTSKRSALRLCSFVSHAGLKCRTI